MTDCLFCKIARNEINAQILFEDDDAVAFADINPQAPTHALVIPRKHLSGPQEIAEDDEKLMGHLFVVARRIAEDAGIAEGGYRLVMNSGEGAGQTVFHAHLHILGGRPFSWPPG